MNETMQLYEPQELGEVTVLTSHPFLVGIYSIVTMMASFRE